VSLRSHGRRWLILASLTVAAMPSWTDAQGPSASNPPNPAAVQTAPAPSATTETQPFWVAGVVITPAQRSAFVVVLDDRRRDVGVVTLREGENYGGYRVATVEADRVFFERNGTVVPVIVGRPSDGPRGAPGAARRPFVILGPDKPTPDVPYTGLRLKRRGEAGAASAPPGNAPGSPAPDPDVLKNTLEALTNHPRFQQRMRERRPLIQRSLELAPQDSQAAPQAPPASPTRD